MLNGHLLTANVPRHFCVTVNFHCINPLESRGNYSATSNNMKLVHWPLLHLVQPHPSTANVPITVLLYNGLLLCGFNAGIKGFRHMLFHCYSIAHVTPMIFLWNSFKRQRDVWKKLATQQMRKSNTVAKRFYSSIFSHNMIESNKQKTAKKNKKKKEKHKCFRKTARHKPAIREGALNSRPSIF